MTCAHSRVPGALEAAAERGCAVCLMHMQGDPRTMQEAPRYGDVVIEVKAFLLERAQSCRAAGIPAERMSIDPGFGFGKTLEHKPRCCAGCDAFGETGLPRGGGLSRKSMLGKILGRPSASACTAASHWR